MTTQKRAGRQVRAYRQSQKLSLQGLAEQLGCHRTFVLKVEKGDSRPQVDRVGDWQRVTGVPAELWYPVLAELRQTGTEG